MNKSSEEKFLQALELCKFLVTVQCKKSTIPFEAIQLFCEIAGEPLDLLHLCKQYSAEIKPALAAVTDYAASVDNWRVDCELGFGVKDHCNFLHFFLNVHTKNFKFFRGENWTPEVICELFKEWKGIDLAPLIEDTPKLAAVES